MTNYLKVDRENGLLVMDKTFAKKADIFGSPESVKLEAARAAYPEYCVVTRKISASTQERYKGLNYEFMEQHIRRVTEKDLLEEALAEFNNMLWLASCHSVRYPHVKAWFLEKYPEVKQFGATKAAAESNSKEEKDNIVPIKNADAAGAPANDEQVAGF